MCNVGRYHWSPQEKPNSIKHSPPSILPCISAYEEDISSQYIEIKVFSYAIRAGTVAVLMQMGFSWGRGRGGAYSSSMISHKNLNGKLHNRIMAITIIPTKTPAFKITFRRGVHFQQPAIIDVAACSQILLLAFIDNICLFQFRILRHPLQTQFS